MAVLSLPLTFNNSFWSQDYRKGLKVLYQKLEQGCAENDEIIAFIRARAYAEGQLATSLTNNYTGSAGVGFGADDGASLLAAFRGLQAESATQGNAHKNIASELTSLVADPFEDWAQNYKDRLHQSKVSVMDNWLKSYEQSQADVAKLKNQYLTKTRRADEAEDDAKFAPTSNGISDAYTTSPRTRPVDGHRTPPQRTASVSERIAQRLKEIQKKSVASLATSTATPTESQSTLVAEPEQVEETTPDKVDKGKGKAVESPTGLASPPPMSPPLPPSKADLSSAHTPSVTAHQPILLAGLAFPPAALSQLLARAAHELKLRPVRVPLLGEYQDCFSGEEFVAWLNENVPGFGGSLDRAEDAARELTEREGLLRRIGELGNQFEHSDDAFYQFRSKAFELERKGSASSDATGSPIVKPETILKRTNNFVNLVSQALKANAANGEPAYLKLRHEAEDADKVYRSAVRRLDRQRLSLEEKIEDTLKALQRWETERLRAIKTVLLQYQGTISNLPKSLESSIERSATLVASYQPESDLTALIERYRTGPFRPDAQVYESVTHEEYDVLFGLDLRRWAESGWGALASENNKDKDLIPPVISALLQGLTQAYERLPNDSEKRKSWIYEVPLTATHHLREALNALPPDEPIPAELFTKYDAPVIASCIKLWILELDPPLGLHEGWDDIRKLYPIMGSKKAEGEQVSEEQRVKDLGAALQKLPRIHLYVLDALVSHVKKLIETTKVEESDEVYITKMALSVGRAILRPRHETEISIQDRHPTLLFIDLVKKYEEILPPTISRKKRESERKLPIRKRTAPIDMRMSRSKVSDISPEIQQQLLAKQRAAQQPPKGLKSPEIPPVPPLPPSVTASVAVPAPALSPPPVSDKTETPAPPAPSEEPATPKPPVFKEPPPEDDNLPPRPQFKDPPPEPDDDAAAPPMPKFADPPAEESEIPSPSVVAPTPTKSAQSASPTKVTSRSPSPTVSDGGKSPIVRSGANIIRGPRITRGPRVQGSSVSSMVSNINNRNSTAGTSSPTRSGSPTSPTYKRLSGSPTGHNRRPSSVLGRSSAFSRRTMASDAEDDVVEKK